MCVSGLGRYLENHGSDEKEKKKHPPGDRDGAAGKDNTVTDREKEERGKSSEGWNVVEREK